MDKRKYFLPDEFDGMLQDYVKKGLLNLQEVNQLSEVLFDVKKVFTEIAKLKPDVWGDDELPEVTCDICSAQEMCEFLHNMDLALQAPAGEG